jgi:hypothetical protein
MPEGDRRLAHGVRQQPVRYVSGRMSIITKTLLSSKLIVGENWGALSSLFWTMMMHSKCAVSERWRIGGTAAGKLLLRLTSQGALTPGISLPTSQRLAMYSEILQPFSAN